jgi:4-amino-4-deoxy-L-arabinose transferase-like glycosyltransferase
MNNHFSFHLLRLSGRNYIVGLFLLAFLLRFGVVLGLRDIHKFHGPSPAGSDAVEFNAIALNLVSGNGYSITPDQPTAIRAPGFPLLLAALYRISYENYALVYGVLCVIGALTCLLTYAVARQLLTEGPARVAGLLAAVYLPHVYYSTLFLSESLFALCVGLALWLFLLHLRTSSNWLLAGAGAVMGYGALARPLAVLFVPLLGLILMRSPDRNWRRLAQRSLVLVASAMVVLLPWSIRNYALYHRFVLIATNGGTTFYGSNNDIVLHDRDYLGSWISSGYLPGRKMIDAAPDEVVRDQVAWALGKQWVRANVSSLPLLSAYKLARFWLPNLTSGNPNFVLMQTVAYTPFAILILLGLAFSLWRFNIKSAPWLAAHAILAANLLCTLVFYGSARFRDSITPVLMIYAVVGLDVLLGRLARESMKNPVGIFRIE